MIFKRLLLVFCMSLVAGFALAQTKGKTYTIADLNLDQVTLTNTPVASAVRIFGDTTYTLYNNSTLPMKVYYVEGEQYDNVFNPNPTGIFINNQHFAFYCSTDMIIRQNFNLFLHIQEFTYGGANYLLLINMREDCVKNCDYRCYNIFDITNPSSIKHYSFSSIYELPNCLGDFNGDNILDFVRAATKVPDDYKKGAGADYYMLTAYSLVEGKAKHLYNEDKQFYYIYGKGNENATSFEVLQADWFFNLVDTSGTEAKKTSYFGNYLAFDPYYKYLYDPDGVRVEKYTWSIFLLDLHDLDAAQESARKYRKDYDLDAYILIDQYSKKINFKIFSGNFTEKAEAEAYLAGLEKLGLQGKVVNFDDGF